LKPRCPKGLPGEVRSYLHEQGVAGDHEILVACSGGPDSSALLHALARLAPELGLRVACAHLDHGIRDSREREDERAAVVRMAARLGTPLETGTVEPGQILQRAHRLHQSVEEAARAERYRFLETTAAARGSSYIALGHTADDAAETLIMRIFQGVDISGLGGIPERRGRLIRPLCHVLREEVEAYCREEGILTIHDSTNDEPQYLRNRVRSELVPAIQRVFPSYRAALRELGRKAAASHGYVRSASAERVRWRRSGRSVWSEWGPYVDAPPVLRMWATYHAMDLLGARRIPYRHLERLLEPVDPRKRGVLLAGSGVRVERRGERVWVGPDIVGRRKIGYLLHVRGPGRYAVLERHIVVEVAQDGMVRGGGDTPLVVRSRRPGDRLHWRGRSASLATVVAGCHPADALDLVPIVADTGGIVRVLGSALGCEDAVAGAGEAGRGAGISALITLEEQ
jgi:tRNA(Ile)-lysidine synthase